MTDHKQSLTVTAEGGAIKLDAEYNSSLPHPNIVEQYEALVPGAAKMILEMAKEQSDHRRHMERSVHDRAYYALCRQQRLQLIGQMSALGILITILGSAVYLLSHGKSIEGIAALLVPAATVAGVVLFKK